MVKRFALSLAAVLVLAVQGQANPHISAPGSSSTHYTSFSVAGYCDGGSGNEVEVRVETQLFVDRTYVDSKRANMDGPNGNFTVEYNESGLPEGTYDAVVWVFSYDVNNFLVGAAYVEFTLIVEL